jgi:hypothetical protein
MAAGCPLLNSYSMPAERLRGCVFAEGFRSYADVVRNSTTITGAPVVGDGYIMLNGAQRVAYDYQPFPRNFSISAWFRADALQNAYITYAGTAAVDFVTLYANLANQFTVGYLAGGVVGYAGTFAMAYADGAWHHVVFAADRVNNLHYVTIDGVVVANGVAGLATVGSVGLSSRFTIGATEAGVGPFAGSIRDVKLWQEVLTTQEAQQLYAQSVYSYFRRMRCFLPMGIQQHDPVGGRTLDVTGNGFHGVFGAGAETPVKLVGQRGYQFVPNGAKVGFEYNAGGDYMTVSALNAGAPWSMAWSLSRQEADVFCYPIGPMAGVGGQGVWDNSAIVGVPGDVGYYNGAVWIVDPVTRVSSSGRIEHMCLTLSVTQYYLYRDSILVAAGAMAANPLSSVTLGRRGNPAAPSCFSGVMSYFAAWNEDLSPLQVADFYARMNMEINDV